MSEVIDLGPHDNMTPEQALAVASREEWEGVIVLGYQPDSDALILRSSHMTREQALWIVEHARLRVLDL
jgi:hypothetical protein